MADNGASRASEGAMSMERSLGFMVILLVSL